MDGQSVVVFAKPGTDGLRMLAAPGCSKTERFRAAAEQLRRLA